MRYVDCCNSCAENTCYDTPALAIAAWNTRHIDPATLALARLGAAVLRERDGVDLSRVTDSAYECVVGAWNTPSIRERVAELLQDAEAARLEREAAPAPNRSETPNSSPTFCSACGGRVRLTTEGASEPVEIQRIRTRGIV
jgi:hypothetical protein